MLTSRDKNILKFIEEYKSITINQASRIFFKNCKYNYDTARRRLHKLFEMGLLKTGKNKITNEMIYYTDKILTPHDLYIYDFYSYLIYYGCEILEFKKDKTFHNIRPDAYIKYRFNNRNYVILLEIDFTHKTPLKKYSDIMESVLYPIFKGYPLVVIISDNDEIKPWEYDVIYLDYNMKNLVSRILGE